MSIYKSGFSTSRNFLTVVEVPLLSLWVGDLEQVLNRAQLVLLCPGVPCLEDSRWLVAGHYTSKTWAVPAFYGLKAFHWFYHSGRGLSVGDRVFLLNVSVIANYDFFDQEGNTVFSLINCVVCFVFLGYSAS